MNVAFEAKEWMTAHTLLGSVIFCVEPASVGRKGTRESFTYEAKYVLWSSLAIQFLKK
jgi:hypothetical protein